MVAAELVTPYDELTGIPYPIAPRPDLPRNRPDIANWHHWFHPKSAPELQTLGGWALRNSLIQLLPIEQHNYGRHTYHNFYMGPPLPDADDEAEQFRISVFTCAGLIADHVIDLSTNEPQVRPRTDTELRFFRTSPMPTPVTHHEMRHYRSTLSERVPDRKLWRQLARNHQKQASLSYNVLRYAYDPLCEFYTSFLLREEMFDVRKRVIEKFLTTDDQQLRLSLADTILHRAASVATAGLVTTYRHFYAVGALHELMPPEPEKLVKTKLGNISKSTRLLLELETRLGNMLLTRAA